MTNPISYQKIGRYHALYHQPSSGVVLHKTTTRYTLLAVADGAPFASNGRLGAQLACESVRRILPQMGQALFVFSAKKALALLLEELQYELQEYCKRQGEAAQNYATTLSLALLDHATQRWLLCNIGDGACLCVLQGEVQVLLPPCSQFGQAPRRFLHSASIAQGAQAIFLQNTPETYLLLACPNLLRQLGQPNKNAQITAALRKRDTTALYALLDALPSAADTSFVGYDARAAQAPCHQLQESEGTAMPNKPANGRIYLQKGATIALSRVEGQAAMPCVIHDVVGEGGSTICYSATYQGKKGRLKEFYPLEDDSMAGRLLYQHFTRTQQQLVPVGRALQQRFAAQRAAFLQAYHILEQARQREGANQILNNYLPPYDILYGDLRQSDVPPTVYVWTPSDKTGVSFAQYLTEAHQAPKVLPLHKLYHIISTVLTITDCITAMHIEGLLHLDVKPSNFLVTYDSNYQINPANISMFDINTIYAVHTGVTRRAGSMGYCAPEVMRGKAENRSDIYSIGAMLFYALMLKTEGQKAAEYQPKDYPRLPQLMQASPLLRAVPAQERPMICQMVLQILTACLAPRPAARYPHCEALTHALKALQALLLPELANTNLGYFNRRLSVVETPVKEETIKLALQNLLFTHPLTQYWADVPQGQMPQQGMPLAVQVLGAGAEAECFLNLALQMGQLPYHPLHITMTSNYPAYEKERYLAARPGIPYFVQIDDTAAADVQGDTVLRFAMPYTAMPQADKHRLLSGKDEAETLAFASEFLAHTSARYFFVAWGDDACNTALATALAKAAAQQAKPCQIAFVTRAPQGYTCAATEVCLLQEAVQAATPSLLEEMAFGVHLSWCDPQNLNIAKEKKEFRQFYYAESSRLFALSVPYKLWNLGISLQSPHKAAAAYQCALQGGEHLATLAMYEHRRWVLEKVVDAWQAPRDAEGNLCYQGILQGASVKDKAKKLHPCLVLSTAATPLQGLGYAAPQYTQWDTEVLDTTLDPLDAMSVRLHQFFCAEAVRRRQKPLLQSAELRSIEEKLAGQPPEIQAAYQAFLLCLQNIINQNKIYARGYKQHEEAFLARLSVLPEALRKEITQCLTRVHSLFFPLVEACLYRDYKRYDETMLRQIPFILTYQANQHLAVGVVPCATGQTAQWALQYIAPARAMYATAITYLAVAQDDAEAVALTAQLDTLLRYWAAQYPSVAVGVLVSVGKAVSATNKEAFKAMLRQAKQQKWLAQSKLTTATTAQQASEQLQTQLCAKQPTLLSLPQPLFAQPEIAQGFATALAQSIPQVSFDLATNTFTTQPAETALSYLMPQHALRAAELPLLQGGDAAVWHLPEFALDYPTLWAMYQGKHGDMQLAKFTEPAEAIEVAVQNMQHWHTLCDILAEHAKTQDLIACFSTAQATQGEQILHECFVPMQQYQTSTTLLEALAVHGIVGAAPQVLPYTTDTCQVRFTATKPIAQQLVFLLMQRLQGAMPSSLCLTPCDTPVQGVALWHSTLQVNACPLAPSLTQENALLYQLQQQQFLYALSHTFSVPAAVSFWYSAPRVKILLTDAAAMLRMYLYYKVCETGYFDDIASGYQATVPQGAGAVSFQIDAVLCKGFSTLFVGIATAPQAVQPCVAQLQAAATALGVCAKIALLTAFTPSADLLPQDSMVKVFPPDQFEELGQALVQFHRDAPPTAPTAPQEGETSS